MVRKVSNQRLAIPGRPIFKLSLKHDHMYNQLQEKRNEIKKAKYIIRALDHSLRQMIIKKISEDGRASVTDLYVFLRLEQSVCSQHLGVLRRAGILTTEREGKSIFYSIDEKVATHVLDSISRLTNVSH